MQVQPLPPDAFYEVLHHSFMETEDKPEILANVIKGGDSRTPIIAYINRRYKPDSDTEVKRM